ncbi:MAG: ferritin-like domain-containing protein [Oscillospiraceae bacterium]
MQLTPKEASLLKDLKGQEQLCVDKYNRHAASANDPQLKNLFEQIAQVEQQHLDAITQMEGGTVAAPADSATVPTTFTATYNNTETPQKQNDCYCARTCSRWKSTPRLYDTCVFEFGDANARSVLNDIQAGAAPWQGHL